MTTAVVLAGSRGGEDPVARHAGVRHKALAPLAGRPMLEHVLLCLAALPDVGRVIVVGSDELSAYLPPQVELLPAASSPAASLRAVVAQLTAADFPLLVTTADHPLLTPAMVAHFRAHLPFGCVAAAAVARAESVRASAPDSLRTYWRFADGSFSGCNLFALATPEAMRLVTFWRRLEADRKRPWRIVRALGPLVLLRFTLGRLTLADGVRRLEKRVGLPLAVVELPFGEAAVDVDRPDDLRLAEQILAARTGA